MATRKLNWKPDESAELSVLGGEADAATSPQAARILELSGKRLHLAATTSVKGGAAVRLEWGGQLVLGQVLDTEPGGFWIEIHHMLLDTAGLDRQRQGWQRG